MSAPDLDAWVSDAQVVTRHRREAATDPDTLWDAARGVRLGDTGTIGRLVRWRIPGLPSDQSFGGMLAEYPFTILADGAHWTVSGLVGKIWTLARDYPRLNGPDDFHAFSEPRSVRVAFAHWIEPGQDGRCALVSEARVEPTDRVAAARLRALWLAIGPFERLIGAEPLTLAVRRAERSPAR